MQDFQPSIEKCVTIPPSNGPVRRKRGTCLLRRTGQNGNVYQQHSKTWSAAAPTYGRIWIDTPTGRRRQTIALGLCRTKTVAKQKLREFIAANKINEPVTYHRITSPTFAAQAASWIKAMSTRRRRPVKPATLVNWSHYLEKRLVPMLGSTPVADVTNAALRLLVDKMAAEGLSAKTICSYASVVKLVIASAVNEEGEQLYPRTWNDEFVGLPIVRKEEQQRQTITAEEVNKVITHSTQRERVLFALLAGTGLRIGEALALKRDDFSEDFLTLRVTRSLWHASEQAPKTPNAVRIVDVHSALAELLRGYAVNSTGYLFATASGRPLSQRNVLRSLHTIVPVGLHAFRRYRAEVLRRAGCPSDLEKQWLGHAPGTVTDLYSLGLRNDVARRKEWAERVGIGIAYLGELGENIFVPVVAATPATATL
jgi:integrase